MSGIPRQEPLNVALIFPPFFFNRFHGPYLAIPHLISYLMASGVNAVSHHDANVEVQRALLAPGSLENLISEHERAKPAVDGSLRKHRLNEILLLAYLRDHPEQLEVDEKAYRQLAGLVLDRYYSEVKKDLGFQIDALGHGLGLPPFNQGINETIAGLPGQTRLVGISVPTADQFYPALVLAQKARERFGDAVHTTLGGCLFSLLEPAELEAILSTGIVDSIVRHEGERALLGLYEHVRGKLELEEICNLIYYQDGHLRFNAMQAPVPLGECPPPYFRRGELASYATSASIPILVTRGCYWGKCTFCDYGHLFSGKLVEIMSASRTCEVIENVIDSTGIRRFDLISDCAPPEFCEQFSAEVMQRGLQIEWTTYLRGDRRFTSELCQQMSTSGCRRVNVGVDSFSSRPLKLMKKGYGKTGIVSFLQNLKGAGIEAAISIIIDFPGTTPEEIQETLNSLRKYLTLYKAVKTYPFSLSRYSEVAKNTEKYGIRVEPEADVHHNRGFHYLKFRRLDGAVEEQIGVLLHEYLRFSAQNERDNTVEQSLLTLRSYPLDSLFLKVQPRFLFLEDEQVHWVKDLMDTDDFGQEEGLMFDVDFHAICRYPAVLRQIYESLPDRWVPVSWLQRLVGSGSEGDQIDEDDCTRLILECGVVLGLFALSCLDPLSEPHHVLETGD